MAASCCSAIYIVMQKHYLVATAPWNSPPIPSGWARSSCSPSAAHTPYACNGVHTEHTGSHLPRHLPRRHGLLGLGYVLSHAPASRTVSLLYLIPVFTISSPGSGCTKSLHRSLRGGALALAGRHSRQRHGPKPRNLGQTVALKAAPKPVADGGTVSPAGTVPMACPELNSAQAAYASAPAGGRPCLHRHRLGGRLESHRFGRDCGASAHDVDDYDAASARAPLAERACRDFVQPDPGDEIVKTGIRYSRLTVRDAGAWERTYPQAK